MHGPGEATRLGPWLLVASIGPAAQSPLAGAPSLLLEGTSSLLLGRGYSSEDEGAAVLCGRRRRAQEACSAFSLAIPSATWVVEVVAWLSLGMPGWPSHEAGFIGVDAERGCFSGDASFAAGKPRAEALQAAATVASEAQPVLFLLPEQRSLSRSGRLGEPFLSLPVTSLLTLACRGGKIKCDQQITPQQGGRNSISWRRREELYPINHTAVSLLKGARAGKAMGCRWLSIDSRGIYTTLSCERIERGIPSLLFVSSSTHHEGGTVRAAISC